MLLQETHIQQVLEYYMGKNTQQRQEFIIDNLKIEVDLADEVESTIEDAKERSAKAIGVKAASLLVTDEVA